MKISISYQNQLSTLDLSCYYIARNPKGDNVALWVSSPAKVITSFGRDTGVKPITIQDNEEISKYHLEAIIGANSVILHSFNSAESHLDGKPFKWETLTWRGKYRLSIGVNTGLDLVLS